MEIEYIELPIPHIIVRNVFNKTDVDRIWTELNFLTHPHKLLPPDKSRSAVANGKILKNNHGVFLQHIYGAPDISDIYRALRNVFTKQFIEDVSSRNIIFEWLKQLNHESVLVSYYEDNDSYLPHKDNSVYTVLVNMFKEPKAFKGGDLTLGTDGYTIPLENNRMIIFPSWAIHGVTPVKFSVPNREFSGLGRYTISNFLYIHNIVPDDTQ
jgi:hypothetical protein